MSLLDVAGVLSVGYTAYKLTDSNRDLTNADLIGLKLASEVIKQWIISHQPAQNGFVEARPQVTWNNTPAKADYVFA